MNEWASCTPASQNITVLLCLDDAQVSVVSETVHVSTDHGQVQLSPKHREALQEKGRSAGAQICVEMVSSEDLYHTAGSCLKSKLNTHKHANANSNLLQVCVRLDQVHGGTP